jgi:hypothetical protein
MTGLIGSKKPEDKGTPAPKKSDKVKITQIESSPTVSPMGQPTIALFGLGDNGEVYVWNFQNRTWVEH